MGSIAPPGLVTAPPQLGENGGPPRLSGQTILQARGDTAYTTEWDSAEQAALDSALARFPADRHAPLERYVRAAACLPKKNVRDVALRVAWLRVTAAARKRKMVDEANSKKQVRRERGQSIFAVQPKPMGGAVGHAMASSVGVGMAGMPGPNMAMASGMPMPAPIVVQPHGMAYAQPVVPLAPMPQLDDHGAGTVGGVGGPLAQLLEQNYAILNQFKQNMAAYKVNENTELLVRFRDNILTVLNHMNSMQGVMQQMPPLPVRLNVELANNFLPKAVANGMCQFPYVPPPAGLSSGPMLGQQGSSTGMTAAPLPVSAPVAPFVSAAAPAVSAAPVAPAAAALPPPEPNLAFAPQPQSTQQPQQQPQPLQVGQQQQQQQQPLPPPAAGAEVPAADTAAGNAAAVPSAAATSTGQWPAPALPAVSAPAPAAAPVVPPAAGAAVAQPPPQAAPLLQQPQALLTPLQPPLSTANSVQPLQTSAPTAQPPQPIGAPGIVAPAASTSMLPTAPAAIIKPDPDAQPSQPAVTNEPAAPSTSQPASLPSATAPLAPKQEPQVSAAASAPVPLPVPVQQPASQAVPIKPEPGADASQPLPGESSKAASAVVAEQPPVKASSPEQRSAEALVNGTETGKVPAAAVATQPSQVNANGVAAAPSAAASAAPPIKGGAGGVGTRSSSAAQLSPGRPSRSTRSMAAKRNPSAAASPSTSKTLGS